MSTPSRTCVIYNPASGRGRAMSRIDGHRACVGDKIEVCATSGPGNAEEIALRAAQDGVGKVIAAGGDGTVHEVANGLLRSGNPDVIFAVWPLGSANDYAHALGISG